MVKGKDLFDVSLFSSPITGASHILELLIASQPDALDHMLEPFGRWLGASVPTSSLVVRILGRIASREEVERLLDGWEQAMAQPDSTRWIAERLRADGVEPPTTGA